MVGPRRFELPTSCTPEASIEVKWLIERCRRAYSEERRLEISGSLD